MKILRVLQIDKRCRIAVGIAASLTTATIGGVALPANAQSATGISCIPAAANDPQPWVHNARLLDSFKPDVPKPQFVGQFHDSGSNYELDIWRDALGIFGELASPIVEADSPTSRLYDVQFDAKSGALSFSTRFPDGPQRFDGQVRGDVIRGMMKGARTTDAVVLQKFTNSVGEILRNDTVSRAQFECEMILFRRY